jgi:predicted nucleotidyltransferase
MNGSSLIERSVARRKTERGAVLLPAALAALDALAAAGISARIIGSLARGQVGVGSDIDFLVLGGWKEAYAAFDIIASAMPDVPFDVVGHDVIDAALAAEFLKDSLDASGLRDRLRPA